MSSRLPLGAVLLALGGEIALGQSWDTAFDHPSDPKYVALDYPVLFVASTGHADSGTLTPPHFGFDVLSTNNPAAHGPKGGLYVLLPTGEVEKLFPLPVHAQIPGLFDTPPGQPAVGAVTEPSISEDGRTVYFAWFHDQTWKPNGGGWQQHELSYKGSDLYRLEIGPLLDDPSVDPASLLVLRLTSKDYAGNPKGQVQQSAESRASDAMNPGFIDDALAGYWGTVDMHPVEMRTETGPHLVWVSDRSRLANSNDAVTESNHNFGLYLARILPDGTLGPARKWQYYTTTSVLSPTPLRDGIAVSYQSTTEGLRRWEIQAISSSGVWSSLVGYAQGSELFHMGTRVVGPGSHGPKTEHFLSTRYYNLNNGGLGQIRSLEIADAGINSLQPAPTGVVPTQPTTLLTIGVPSTDEPSPQKLVGGKLQYVGKFAAPRGGRKGGSYLVSYSPTSANRIKPDADGQKDVFDVRISFRPSLQPFDPLEPVNVAAGKGLRTVIDETSGQYHLLWPTPALSWKERYGEPQQAVSPSIVDPKTTVPKGMPHAQVGSSPVWNTDLRNYECYLGGVPFNPSTLTLNEKVALHESIDGLRYVQDPLDYCQKLKPGSVLGIAVQLTSNRPDLGAIGLPAYVTDGELTNGNGHKEAAELLGFYDVRHLNQSDQSFQALVPAKTPFEFHLIDRRYGMKLVDVRSWHSLQPRETRTNCGGCHQHEAGFAKPFAGTEAASKPPLDMLGQTQRIVYSPSCKPVVVTTPAPTWPTPEWNADVWPGFQLYCSGCHDSDVSQDAKALAAFDYVDGPDAYETMIERWYASSSLGALGSPVFWAAYGKRTDGRINSLPEYQPDPGAGVYGWRFSPIHATSPGICAGQDPAGAEWVRMLGQWIDNHMPRDTGLQAQGYAFDRFHPTVDFAISESIQLRVGYWDNSGSIDLEIHVNGSYVTTLHGLPNGSFEVPLPGLGLDDRIRLIAVDPSGNRQIVERTGLEVALEFIFDPTSQQL